MALRLSMSDSLGLWVDGDPSQCPHLQVAHWSEMLSLSKPQFTSVKWTLPHMHAKAPSERRSAGPNAKLSTPL